MTRPECQSVHDDLAELVAGEASAIARHAEHLASCDECRDTRHEVSALARQLPHAGDDHVLPVSFVDALLARVDAAAEAPVTSAPVVRAPDVVAPVVAAKPKPAPATVTMIRPRRRWLAVAAAGALAAAATTLVIVRDRSGTSTRAAADEDLGAIATIDRASKDATGGLELRAPDGSWHPLAARDRLRTGAALRTDERTRAAVELADGSRVTLDYRTQLTFTAARAATLTAGRISADVAHVDGRPASIETPSGTVTIIGTQLAVTATDDLTVVQVVRGAALLRAKASGQRDDVRAGEEGVIDHGALAVSAAPGLARELAWAELAATPVDTEAGAGLGALRAYKPGETRDRDWNLALAHHDVKVRIVGPIARTEITETFRNDTDQTLEGVYQFPLPPDAQIDGLALDVADAPGGFQEGAFVDKRRAQKIWKGVIDKAAPRPLEIAQNDIIWVDGSWRDPALLDWKRGGRFELRIFPIPAKGARTIKLAYTQVVAARGAWRQYVYPLPHSSDGSTVADNLTVDVEVRGGAPGQVRTAGYALTRDPARADVNGLAFAQPGFVPRGDLVVEYRAADGDAELRAWTYAGNFAVGPDEALAAKDHVGNDAQVLAAQRAVAADARPTAVIALRPTLPRWREAKARDYVLVVDSSQSMVGERSARARELAMRLVEQLDRRDRFSAMACDSTCRSLGALQAPSVAAAAALGTWLDAQPAAGASDVVASIRAAAAALPDADRERWVIVVSDGFASTGFRRAGDVAAAVADATHGINVSTIGIGSDADSAVLAAAARGGGGSYVAWVPGQSVKAAALASLESTLVPALRDATVTLPAGLADVAPGALPTIRSGEELLLAARLTGPVSGDVIVKGTVAGQPFEQRYPLALAVSTSPGNGFVPRLWATLAIAQLEQHGAGEDRARIVALSQAYGVMSKETSLLVLESAAMFDAFGVDRAVPAAKWTGQESLDEVVASGALPVGGTPAPARPATRQAWPSPQTKASRADMGDDNSLGRDLDGGGGEALGKGGGRGGAPMAGGWDGGDDVGGNRIAMRRTWVRVPALASYDGVSAGITKAIADGERALLRTPDSREAYRALVQTLAYAGELDRANQLAAKWLDRDRLDPLALGYQADLLGRDGQREVALRMLDGTVDLDPDRVESHERLAVAYERLGRAPEACGHRIALSSIAPNDAKAGAAAVRCLRAMGRDRDAALIVRGLADDATRAAAEQALATAPAALGKRDVTIAARWDGGDDLDLTLVTPDGTRVSWMGGAAGLQVDDATSAAHEQLALASIKRGNYLVEIGRGAPGRATVRGSIDVSVLGTTKSFKFELAPAQPRVTVARLAVRREERLESIGGGAVTIAFGTIPNPAARRVMLARSPDMRACFASASEPSGTIMLTITVDDQGQTSTRASAPVALRAAATCLVRSLQYMHVEGTPAGTFRVPVSFEIR